METKQQIDHLIELAIVQRAELKRLVEQLPALRSYLLEQINATIEDMEPQLRGDLIDFCDEKTSRKIEEIHAFFNGAKSEFKTKSDEFFVALEKGAQARFEELQREKQIALDFAEDARRNLAAAAEQEAAKIPAQVSQLVEKELARFPRAGEIDQLRKEFAEPRGLNPRGKWKSTETYQKLDLVAFNGDSYISNVNDNREKPSRTSVSWTLSAARGQGAGGGGISSLNDLVGPPTSDLDVVGAEGSSYVRKTLTAGTNVSLTETPTSITISADDPSSQILTATVTNAESIAITRGQVVYAYQATGNRVSVKLASNTSDATSAKTFGVVSDASISAGGTGTVTCFGMVDQLNLGSYNEGDTVYLSATPGAFTSTKPYAPNHLVYVGIIARANNGNGQLYVRIQNGYELDEIHDVQITAPVLSGSTLLYDATNSLWKNARLTGTANQVKVTNADNSVTLGLESQIAISGQSLTGSSATSLLDLSTTWNTTGNPTALKLNVTNTASGSTSNLLDLQVGGTSQFKVSKAGLTTIGTSSTTNLLVGTNTDSSNGAIQLAAHTTLAGGIGFGTDLSLWRRTVNALRLGPASGGKTVEFEVYNGSGNVFKLTYGYAFSPELFADDPLSIRSNSGAITLKSANVTALTLTSAQQVQVNSTTASTSTSTGALVVSGGVGVAGAGWFGGTLNVGGGTIDVTSTNSAKISVSSLNSSGTLSLISNTAANYRSIQFGYGATPTYLWKIGYQGGSSNDQLNFESGSVGTVAQLTPAGALTLSSSLTVLGTTASTSTSTGALVVSGGVGIAADLWCGNKGNFASGLRLGAAYSAIDVVTAASGLYLSGAQGATDHLFINPSGQVQVVKTTDSSSTTTGALVVSGGLGVAKTITAGGVIVNKAYTVATLPAAASYTYGTCAVSDAINAAGTGLGISPTGGGSVKRLVYSDGSNWLLL